jgi:hypothetical protein
MTTYVYWIHHKHQTDPFSEGYVGISIHPEGRFNYHKNKTTSDNAKLTREIKRGATQTILHSFAEREEALSKELYYRPQEYIGWNIIPGGVSPPSQLGKIFSSCNHGMRNKKHTEHTKQIMSKNRKQWKWYNNGIVSKRSEFCPEGFSPGRLKMKQRSPYKDTSKMGRPKKILL